MKLHHLALAAVAEGDCSGRENGLECATQCSTDSGYAKLGRGLMAPLYTGKGKSFRVKFSVSRQLEFQRYVD